MDAMNRTHSARVPHGRGAINVSTRLLSLIALLLLIGTSLSAQSFYVSRIWMRVYGDANAQENVVFGNTEINTFGIDSTAPDEFKELEPPVPALGPLDKGAQPLQGFDCIWVLPPGHAGAWGSYRGLLRRDWRHMDGMYEARRDTWALKFAQNDNSAATISFKWPDAASLAAECDSLILIDVSQQMGWPNNRLDMFTTDTLDVVDALDRFIAVFRIIKIGSKGTLGVREQGPVPYAYSLSSSFPNPFNPGTTFTASVPQREFARISICDLLGHEVETLFSGTLDAGTSTFSWDAAGRPSGVYFVVLATEHHFLTRKLVLAR